jgi:hypothetical protein
MTTFHNEAGAAWKASGNSSFTGPNQLITDRSIAVSGVAVMVGGMSSTGSISVTNAGTLEVGAAGSAAAGSFTIDAGIYATLSGSISAASIVDNGNVLFCRWNHVGRHAYRHRSD